MGINDHKPDKKRPRTPTPSTRSAAPSGDWQGFVNVYLPDSAKKQWFNWAADPQPFFDALRQLTDDGYKVTLKYDDRSSAYTAFITPAAPGHENSGWGMSERAGDPYTALNRVVYIHAVICAGDWTPYKRPTGYQDDWG